MTRGPTLALARLGATSAHELAQSGVVLLERISGSVHSVVLTAGARLQPLLARGALVALARLRARDKLPPLPPGAASGWGGPLQALTADARGRTRALPLAALGLASDRRGALRAARRPWVYRVARLGFPRSALSAGAGRAIGVDELQGFALANGVPTYGGLSGAGVQVGLVDSGVDGAQLDLQRLGADGQPLGPRVSGAPPPSAAAGHGTGVAGVLAGNGYNSAQFTLGGAAGAPFQWRGQAPQAELISLLKGQPWVPALLPALLSNHSYPMSYGSYDNATAFVDGAVHRGLEHQGGTHPPRPVVWAAGNAGLEPAGAGTPAGYYSLAAVAKNAIVVGGSNVNDGSFCRWASHGPTPDGRLKPDLVAPFGRDTRPPAGVGLQIASITLRGPQRQVSWRFEQQGELLGWQATAGMQQLHVSGGALHAVVTLGGATTGGPPPLVDGAALSLQPLQLAADGLDTLELQLRLSVETEQGRYGWPALWRVGWRRAGAPDQPEELLQPLQPAQQRPGWQTLTAALPAGRFSGTIVALTLEPVIYLDGLVVPAAGSQSYQLVAGTSYAAPAVSGTLALLLQPLQQRGVDLQRDAPWPSSWRALLVHTARDLVQLSAVPRDRNNPDTGAPTLLPEGPDFASGYGLLDARAASELLAHHGPGQRKLVQHRLEQGTLHSYGVAVPAGSEQLRATLAWDDPAGNPLLALSAPQLVNDLDLVLVEPSGRAHGPWVLQPPPMASGGRGADPIGVEDLRPARRCVSAAPWASEACRDRRNNLEQVLVHGPQAGWWRVLVRGTRVPEGPQRYSLVLSAACR